MIAAYQISRRTKNKKLKLFPSGSDCWQSNTGYFDDSNKIGQKELINNEDCISWCNEEERCLAVAISPANWAYRECFRVTVTDIGSRSGWTTAYKSCFGTNIPGKIPKLIFCSGGSCSYWVKFDMKRYLIEIV